MDYEKLKSAAKKIELSEEGKARILRNCQPETFYETKAIKMKKANHWFKKPAAVVAVVSLCLCLTVAAAAASHSGFFKDITNWRGAITGTQYEQATEEIEIAVVSGKNEITVCAEMLHSALPPYNELEAFGVKTYKILDMSGKTVIEGEETEHFALTNGKAEIIIPLDTVSSGAYRLVITSFVGTKKADQPLQINGTWECEFSL